MYIIYDTKRDLYYNFIGRDREDEIETIRNWFDKEYLTVAIDKVVIDKIK